MSKTIGLEKALRKQRESKGRLRLVSSGADLWLVRAKRTSGKNTAIKVYDDKLPAMMEEAYKRAMNEVIEENNEDARDEFGLPVPPTVQVEVPATDVVTEPKKDDKIAP